MQMVVFIPFCTMMIKMVLAKKRCSHPGGADLCRACLNFRVFLLQALSLLVLHFNICITGWDCCVCDKGNTTYPQLRLEFSLLSVTKGAWGKSPVLYAYFRLSYPPTNTDTVHLGYNDITFPWGQIVISKLSF